MSVKTEVYKRLPARHDMCGQFLGYPLKLQGEQISQGMAQRLVRYALATLDDAGFKQAVAGWECVVGTCDGEDRPSERVYYVTWTNAKGGELSVVGIMTRNGWPSLDHGLEIAR
jgi:hypothetical protein